MFTVTPTTSILLRDQSNVWSFKTGYTNQLGKAPRLRCAALSRPTTSGLSRDYKELIQEQLSVIKKHEIVEGDSEGLAVQVFTSSAIEEHLVKIRAILNSMEDGEITISPYDTAWVALVKGKNGGPQFPASLQWIVDNQLPDGSWGDNTLFLAHDRLINTLACIIALKSWNVHPDKFHKGISFLKENICRLEDEKAEHMPIGFEVAFPALIEFAQSHGIENLTDSPSLQQIYAMRKLKLSRIPKEIMHRMPTTLLHSLEGMTDLDWDKLLKLQCKDGSFLFSPSSTAYALKQTKDLNCLNYLNKVVQRFNGGVPNVYPIDLFEHLWIVDRLLRLGISRHFESEIKECLSYVNRYWTERGICWARNSEVQDIDDTAMAFRLLRLHGYEVSADVFENFQKEGEFFCFVGQSTQAVTGMYNLLRASQLQYPREKILENARNFSYNYLREKQACNQLLDKWIITKDLPGEVAYALDIPWYASLPRIETRFYIEQYGGEDDVWIGKTLYRMPYVNNNLYLELAKMDYNNCQALHRLEWNNILRWYSEYNIGEFGVSQSKLLLAYFLPAASIYEPEKSRERLAWAKTATLMEAIVSEFRNEKVSWEDRRNFVDEFQHSYRNQDNLRNERTKKANKRGQRLVGTLMSTLSHLSLYSKVTLGRDILNQQLYQAWEKWLRIGEKEGDMHKGKGELLAITIELCAGRCVSVDAFDNVHILGLLEMTDQICHKLGHILRHDKTEHGRRKGDIKIAEVETDMQRLTELALSNSPDDAHSYVKRTCLAIIKSSYYVAYFSLQEIDHHILKVLFQKID